MTVFIWMKFCHMLSFQLILEHETKWVDCISYMKPNATFQSPRDMQFRQLFTYVVDELDDENGTTFRVIHDMRDRCNFGMHFGCINLSDNLYQFPTIGALQPYEIDGNWYHNLYQLPTIRMKFCCCYFNIKQKSGLHFIYDWELQFHY